MAEDQCYSVASRTARYSCCKAGASRCSSSSSRTCAARASASLPRSRWRRHHLINSIAATAVVAAVIMVGTTILYCICEWVYHDRFSTTFVLVAAGVSTARDRVPSNDLPQLLSVSSSAIICVTLGPDKLSPGVQRHSYCTCYTYTFLKDSIFCIFQFPVHSILLTYTEKVDIHWSACNPVGPLHHLWVRKHVSESVAGLH